MNFTAFFPANIVCSSASRISTMFEYFGVKLLLFYTFNVCIAFSYIQNGQTDHRINTTYEDIYDPATIANPKQIRWADAAFNYLTHLDCRTVFFSTQKECQVLLKLQRAEVNIYLADPQPDGRLATVLPDGSLSRAGSHDGVLVVDPYPQANFGHLVVVFFIDLGMSPAACQAEGGLHLGQEECLTLALKNRCRNILERRRRARDASDSSRWMRKFARRCEINFLPLVHLYSNEAETRTQLLTCRENIPGYGRCPNMRPANESTEIICNPILDNTRRCETSHDIIETRCRVFEICDQAVVISGGWNRQASVVRHRENAVGVYHLLRNNGFLRKNIKMFFANGMAGGIEDKHNAEPHEVYPAAMKLAMRYHIKRMCESPHCVDSLVLYLNSPAKSDGSMFLWDANQDGQAEESEVYTVEELLDDLSNCEARIVQVIADQSYSGEIARAVRKSRYHRNVVVFASGGLHEYSYGNIYTQHWLQYNHTHSCTHQAQEDAVHKIHITTPDTGEQEGLSHVTIFGAPCDVRPPFTQVELRRNYLGCQNIPTALWFIKMLGGPLPQTPRFDGSSSGPLFLPPRYKVSVHDLNS